MSKNTANELPHPDYILLGAVIILVILGVIILASISSSLSFERFESTSYYLRHQIIFGILPGVVFAFFAFRVSMIFLKKIIIALLVINLLLMGLVFLPKIGLSFGGAARWITLGPILIQPSEFLKVTFSIYLASWLATRTLKKREWGNTLFAFLIITGILSLLLILQPDIGTLVIIVTTSVIMYFLADTPVWHTVLILLIGAFALFLLIKFEPYRANRFLVFLKPETDPMGMGYQIKQALISVGSGGIFGRGLGMSRQKFGFVPQTMTDSIFAIFSEEAGFIGDFILIIVFLVIFWRGFKIANHATDKFSRILALAITFWVTLQAFINIGSMIGMLPLTGVPLPFISYGGSHLITELFGMGILLNISRYSTI
jgi:cell division protein FtsW